MTFELGLLSWCPFKIQRGGWQFYYCSLDHEIILKDEWILGQLRGERMVNWKWSHWSDLIYGKTNAYKCTHKPHNISKEYHCSES